MPPRWSSKNLTAARLRLIALAAAFLVPLGLLHAYLLAEIGIGVTDILFLVQHIRRNPAVFRQIWFIAALVWWVWLLVCSMPIPSIGLVTAGWSDSFVQAAIIIRFLVFALALQTWLLTTPKTRRFAFWLLAASCLWIGLESWQQYLTGRNVFGDARWADGALTGPFWKPRAGVLYSHLLGVAVIPPAIILVRRRIAGAVAATILLGLAAITAVLIGQRMCSAFTLLALVTAAALVPRLRLPAALAIAAAIAVLLATPVISPPTHAKLVVETSTNMHHFTKSPYGELFIRAAAMGLQSPWHGFGYNAFRTFCADPRFDPAVPRLHLPPTSVAMNACNLHPHNFYLQAFEESGLPGLTLFILVNLLWLAALFKNLRATPDPLRIGLFIAVLTYAWPIASTDAFPTLYEPGWLFFILGLGLACATTTSNAPYRAAA
jgi:O-antigen ligase